MKNQIATEITMPQLSPRLFDNLAFNPIIINGDMQKLALLKSHIETILSIGDLEHTGDWDPYLIIKTKRKTFESASGYPEIEIGDFSEDEQETALRHYSEITNIGIYNEDESVIWIPAKDILTIQLMR